MISGKGVLYSDRIEDKKKMPVFSVKRHDVIKIKFDLSSQQSAISYTNLS